MKEVFLCDYCSYVDENRTDMYLHEQQCLKQKEREIQHRKEREETGQLTISQIIEKCKLLPNLPVIVYCEQENKYIGKYPCDVDSYRGYYDELAIEVSDTEIKLEDFFIIMNGSIHGLYYGYKGGEYGMYDDTFVWVAEFGLATGLAVIDLRLSNDKTTIQLVTKYLD